MNPRITASIVVVVLLLIVAYSATFFVHQSQNAVVVRFGKLVDTIPACTGESRSSTTSPTSIAASSTSTRRRSSC
jgi:regulator of protease activity HflC (stomatin/prohibitin superfamily)